MKTKKEIFPFKCQWCGKEYEARYKNPSASPYTESENLHIMSKYIIRDIKFLIKGYAIAEQQIKGFETCAEDLLKQSKALVAGYKNLLDQMKTLGKKPSVREPGTPPRNIYFDDVAMFWGFICLRDKKHLYFGFTCPEAECKKTSINRYLWEDVKKDFQEAIDHIPKAHEQHYNTETKWFVIPFSPSILINHLGRKPDSNTIGMKKLNDPEGYAECINLNVNINEYDGTDPERFDHLSKSLSFAAYVPRTYLPGSFHYRINPNDIDTFLKIENEGEKGKRYKAFPRVVRANSIYLVLDDFCNLIYGPDGTVSDYCERMKNILIAMTDKNYEERKWSEQKRSWSYRDWAEDNISLNMYKKLNTKKKIDEDILLEHAKELHPEYRHKRNLIDFEIIYKKDLLNKYCRKLFGEKDWKTENRQKKEQEIARDLRKDAEDILKEHPDLNKTQVARKIKERREKRGDKPYSERSIQEHIARLFK